MLNTVLAQLKTRRQRDETALLERRLQLYQDIPALRDIDSALSRAVAQLIPLGGQLEALQALRQEYFKLKTERGELLRRHGLTEDALDPVIYCAECRDEGYIGGNPCRCVLMLCAQAEKELLSSSLDLHGQTFESFRLDVYSDTVDPDFGVSPRQLAQKNLMYCRQYAEQFTPASGHILMIGFPGLGKTFLSAAIAGIVADKGFSVVYDSAVNIMAVMEREKFNGQDASSGSTKYLGCDLLILDDLGTEMNTAFTQSALYTLINARTHKPTVINTNLTEQELASRYSSALYSRLHGLYHALIFFGEDIRGRV